jgi:hypothetical protein
LIIFDRVARIAVVPGRARRKFLRQPWLPDEVKNALLGHDDGSAAQDYGEFYIRTVLYEAITKIKSPFDKEWATGVVEVAGA